MAAWRLFSMDVPTESLIEERDICHVSITSSVDLIDIKKYSSFNLLKRLFAWTFRFLNNCHAPNYLDQSPASLLSAVLPGSSACFSLRLASLSSLCCAGSSACFSLRLASLSSLCCAGSSACRSPLRLVNRRASSAVLVRQLVSPFVLLASLLSAVLSSSACRSLRLANRRARSVCCVASIAPWCVDMLIHSLRLGRRRRRPYYEIICTTRYMGLAQSWPAVSKTKPFSWLSWRTSTSERREASKTKGETSWCFKPTAARSAVNKTKQRQADEPAQQIEDIARRREKQADEPAQQREERLARRREKQADEPGSTAERREAGDWSR